MEDSTNFSDFVQRLWKLVCSKVSSDDLVYFTLIQAIDVGGYHLGELRNCYPDSLLLHPIDVEIEEIQEAIDKVLATNPVDWIEIHLQGRQDIKHTLPAVRLVRDRTRP